MCMQKKESSENESRRVFTKNSDTYLESENDLSRREFQSRCLVSVSKTLLSIRPERSRVLIEVYDHI